jgi:putative flippase GtrA
LTDFVAFEAHEACAAGTSVGYSAISRRLFSDLFRYALCSGLALALDWGLLVALVALGVRPLLAAATSFCAGMALTYFGSIFFVFPDRRGRGIFAEATGFVSVGLAGLACNQILLWLFVSELGLNVALAKAPTAICVFLFNFVLRRSLVFAKRK